jgi:hypothetical protein
MQARFIYRNDEDRRRVLDAEGKDLDRINGFGDMAKAISCSPPRY